MHCDQVLAAILLAITLPLAPYALGLVRRVNGLKPIGWNREGVR